MSALQGRFVIDEGLDTIDLSFPNYTPTIQALTFFNTMRIFFGEDFETNNPIWHYFIVDMLFGNVTKEMFPYSDQVNDGIRINKSRVAIIAARGLAKSTVTTFFYPIYCAITGTTPVTGPLSHILILSDSAKGGAKDQALLLGNAFDKSEWAKTYFESIRHTETEVEVVRRNPSGKDLPIEKRHMLIKFKGAQTGGIRSGSRNPVTMDRYAIIIADDVIKNEAEAYSDTIMKNVNTALSSDAINAMRAKKTQFVLINTPFHKNDPVYMSMENGVFTPLVVPICKEIRDNLTEEEYIGAWPEMHDYASVMERYLNAKGNNNLRSFYQELMLRVTSDEDRMVQDDMLEWYDRRSIEKYLGNYNLYMTTDLTSSSEGTGDYSAAYLWAVNSNQDYFMIDMSLKKQSIGDQYNEILKMVQRWCSNRYVEVAIEVDGQQRLNIYALKELMLKRNTFFTFARQKGAAYGKEGISSRAAGGSKFDRFRMVYPLLQAHKIHFPTELRNSPDMQELLNELKYVSFTGFKSKHDDGLDAVSQLVMIDMMFPSEAVHNTDEDDKLTDVNEKVWGSFNEKEAPYDQSTVF